VGIPFNSTASGAPATLDQANVVVSGTFTAAGQVSPAYVLYGVFNLFVYANGGPNAAWTGSVQLERSFDGGVTWVVCGVGGGGIAQAIYASGLDVSITADEPERGMGYRIHCTALSAGAPLNYRLSSTGVLGTSNGIPS
jgi:hypothetical protein